MEKVRAHVPAAMAGANADPVDPDLVREHLRRILLSPAFRSSKRCSEFLSFVVERTLEHRANELKERTIGTALFGRAFDYDTPGDPVVRVKASDIRKRLAQYYSDPGTSDSFRIDLPPGSYVPEFHLAAVAAPAMPVPPESAAASPGMGVLRPSRTRRRLALACLLVLIAVAGAIFWTGHGRSELDLFWDPVIRSDRPPMICVGGSGQVWVLTSHLKSQIDQIPVGATRPSAIQALRSDAIPLSNHYFSGSSLKAAVGVSLLLANRGIHGQVRPGASLSLEDFRSSPVIAVGAFTNPWTLQRNAELRFRFDRGGSDANAWLAIVDGQNPKNRWQVNEFPFGPSTVDYAVITRLFDSGSGNVFVSLAGLNAFGTEAAAEFATNPRYWRDLASHAPRGWDRKNLQIVLQTAVVEARPSPPRIVEAHFW